MSKSIKCILIFVVMCVCLSACDTDYSTERRPPEDFSSSCSDYGVATGMIPEDFISKFPYSNGYFCHYVFSKSFFSSSCSDRALLFMEYDKQTYDQAKEYVFATMDLSDESVETYNEYVFYDNYTAYFGINAPYQFKRFAFNDSKKTLIFIGHYSFQYYDILEEYSDDWGAFLNDFYGDWYDFSA